MTRTLERSWTFHFDHPVDRVWPIVADTARWNEAAGIPKHQVREELQADGSVRVLGRLRVAGYALEWEEMPVNWIENQWFEQVRRFLNGPLAELGARVQLTPQGSACTCSYHLALAPANLLGRLLARRILTGFGRGAAPLFAAANRNLSRAAPDVIEYRAPRISRAARARAAQIAERLESTPHGHGLAQKLVDFVLGAQEVDLWSLRPLALARRWGVAERLAIELCLEATRHGLLGSRWDLLCPRCRIAKSHTLRMDELPEGVHCAACNIDYRADFASNVELTFHPNPAIRPAASGDYCRAGPGVTPHVRGQVTLAPGERRSLPATLAHGAYRVRTLECGGEQDLDWHARGFPLLQVDGSEVHAAGPAPPGVIALHNRGAVRRTLIIEDRAWRRDVLTAERVMTLQVFRDLFSEQVLRPGDEVAIAHVTFMFTDLAGSTALFARIGDARAYRVVREHFALLGEIVRRHDGSIVKTVGDGVHAAFVDPGDALRAALAIQSAMAEFDAEGEPVAARIGLHGGNSISVTLNDRLDYYGSTVNMAARLEGQGEGGEIVLSEALADDPAVQPLLARYRVHRARVRLKGFAQEVAICRFAPVREPAAAGDPHARSRIPRPRRLL